MFSLMILIIFVEMFELKLYSNNTLKTVTSPSLWKEIYTNYLIFYFKDTINFVYTVKEIQINILNAPQYE